jgi:hypothetical protein
MASQQSKIGLLNSWKEIAAYLDRGVRTVQRWEKQGLPVRRLSSGPRAPVIATTTDIDAWIQSSRSHGFGILQSAEQSMLRRTLHLSVEQSRALCHEMALLREHQRNGIQKLLENIAALEKSCGRPRFTEPFVASLPMPSPGELPRDDSQSRLQQAS